ncbi:MULTISPECIES: nitroreductase/quinone reductase family protein [unclassified Micromonospora]|uniref:nitroreductase/quinone reductase family protein n=1 Tax=unclassified Micromonospora TaxID=2617518 RepID=UPI00363F773A
MSAIGTLTRRLGHRRWFGATIRLLVPVDRAVGRLTRGRVVALGLVPSLVITTTGRRSGLPRSNPLLYVPDGDAYVVVGSNWGQQHQPAWALNLLADPAAEVDVRGRRVAVRAEVATGAERDRLWELLITEWPAYQTYVERAGGREIRVFRLVPFLTGRPGCR